jgi:hypothetical protein
MKTNLALTIILFLFNCQASISQSVYDTVINFHSLEDKDVFVKYGYDPNKDRLILELNPTEKMCIQGARGANAKIFLNKFVELESPMPGGSGESVHRLFIICVADGKLYKSIDVVAFVKDYTSGECSFEVKFSDLIKKSKSFELIVNVVNKETKLQFDFENKIFYNDFVNLNGPYIVEGMGQMNFQNEKFPAVTVDPAEMYLFIKHKWYAKAPYNWNLDEFSSDCN